MRSIKDYLALFVFFLAVPAGAQTTLPDYLLTAAENNAGLKADFANYLAAAQRVPQVGTLPDPQAAFSYFASPTETRVGPVKAKVSLSQRFPWFGLLNAQEDVASERANTFLERFRENKSKLFYDVKTAYFSFYFVARAIDITHENLDILETFRQLALIKFEAGLASAVDEFRVEMDLADLQNELAYLQDRKYELQVRFNKLLNVDADSEVVIPDVLWNESIEEDRVQLMARIVEQNHSVRQIEHSVTAWEHQKVVARKQGKVDFDIGIDYSYVGNSRTPLPDPSESGQDTIVAPRIGISIPLYRKKYRAMIEEASQKSRASSFEKSDRINALRSLFETGYKDYRDGNRRVDLYLEQTLIANQAMDLLLAEYATNGSDFEEVLRMQRRVLKYELALDRARSDKNVAMAFIDYLLGS